MSPTFRRMLVLCAAALIAVSALGCSKKKNPVDPIPDLAQEDADDMMQQVAMMIASDHGGWLVDMLSTREAMPAGGPVIGGAPSLTQRVLMVSSSSGGGGGFRTNRDTVVTRGSMNFSFSYIYSDTASHDTLVYYTPDVISVDGVSIATGAVTTPGFDAFFSHKGDPFTVTGFEAGSDTINFSGVGDDSMYVVFTPAFRTGSRRFATVSFVDYDLNMVRDPAGNPYPTSGIANMFLFADVLRSPSTSDVFTTLESTVTYYFDGTATPIVWVTNDLDNPTPKYRYRADLRTGAITRLP